MEFLNFITNNIWHVGPNIALGIFALTIAIERFFTLFGSPSSNYKTQIIPQIYNAISKANIKEGIDLCNTRPQSFQLNLIKEALIRAHLTESNIQDGLSIGLQKANALLQKRTGFLAMIANVTTLIGLLGTISGLIRSFQAISLADPTQKSALLATGISTALNATLIGLSIAIPCLLLYSFLSNKTNEIVTDLDSIATETLDALKQRIYQIDASQNNG